MISSIVESSGTFTYLFSSLGSRQTPSVLLRFFTTTALLTKSVGSSVNFCYAASPLHFNERLLGIISQCDGCSPRSVLLGHRSFWKLNLIISTVPPKPVNILLYSKRTSSLVNSLASETEFTSNSVRTDRRSNCSLRLWRWLPHRSSKRHSLTVLLRTPITHMIFFNLGNFSLVGPDNNEFGASSCLASN